MKADDFRTSREFMFCDGPVKMAPGDLVPQELWNQPAPTSARAGGGGPGAGVGDSAAAQPPAMSPTPFLLVYHWRDKARRILSSCASVRIPLHGLKEVVGATAPSSGFSFKVRFKAKLSFQECMELVDDDENGDGLLMSRGRSRQRPQQRSRSRSQGQGQGGANRRSRSRSKSPTSRAGGGRQPDVGELRIFACVCLCVPVCILCRQCDHNQTRLNMNQISQ